MLAFDVLSLGLFGLVAFLSSAAAVAAGHWVTRASVGGGDWRSDDLAGDTLLFLIRGGHVRDANFAARRWLERGDLGDGDDLSKLRLALAPLFEDAATLTAPSGQIGDRRALARDGVGQAIREISRDVVRLKLRLNAEAVPSGEDIHRLDALERELEVLRANTESAPFLVWRQSEDGDVTWINRAYVDLVREIYGSKRTMAWPLPHLFTDLGGRRGDSQETHRHSVALVDGTLRWFDCYATPVGCETLYTAVAADDAVQAEEQRREFTQTLTKTFADLPIGLALFDRSRELALFNPALTDLIGLSAEYLLRRPTLAGFLDTLRERNKMPEPKDYKSWRRSIADLEEAAEKGSFAETWSLPGNQTYRVTGRPHPDGAIALLFEDISAEMSLTRRFRSELELGQSVLDTMDEAVAVFSGEGLLTMSNAAYSRIWGDDPEAVPVEMSVTEATRAWHEATLPTPVWGDFRDFTAQGQDRAEWGADALHRDGRRISCRFTPLPGGSTLASFRVAGSAGVTLPELIAAG